jgi:hypothetical protein
MKGYSTSRAMIAGALAASMAVAGFMPLSSTPAQAMPAKPIGLNDGAPSLVESVQYRRRYVRSRRGNAAAAGIALGVLGLAAGAAIAAQNRPDYYYYDDYPRYAPRAYYSAPPTYYYERPAPRYYSGPAYRERYYGGGRYYRRGGGNEPGIGVPDSGSR